MGARAKAPAQGEGVGWGGDQCGKTVRTWQPASTTVALWYSGSSVTRSIDPLVTCTHHTHVREGYEKREEGGCGTGYE